jgi:hypothetical protein
MFHHQRILQNSTKDLHNSSPEYSCTENHKDTAMQDYDEDNDTGKDKDELGVITLFNAFCLTTSENTTNSTDLSTTEMKDDFYTNTVHLNDIELSSFFKCSDDEA